MIKNAFILNFLKLYNILWGIVLPLLKKNRRLSQGFEKRISANHLPSADIWIQAASAGEAYLAVRIIEEFIPDEPAVILVTTLTRQGKDILHAFEQKKKFHPDICLKVEWFPFDRPELMQKAVKKISPKAMVLLETEIWPALLYYLKQQNIPIGIINARLSKGSFNAYRATKYLWDKFAPDLIMPTSRQDARRFIKIFKYSQIKPMSNIKFENLAAVYNDRPDDFSNGPGSVPARPLTVLASIRSAEEKLTLKLIERILTKYPGQTIALFPRHMHRIQAWRKRLKKKKLPFILRSKTKHTGSCINTAAIILWDTFGELKQTYPKARVVFVGGSLKPLGGQNFLEPALCGIPTITGPFYDDFHWAGEEIFQQGIIYREKTWQAVAEKIVEILETPQNSAAKTKIIQSYIQSKKGGTQAACKHMRQMMKNRAHKTTHPH